MARTFGAMLGTAEGFQPRLNIAPTTVVPVIRCCKGTSVKLDLLRWGLVPSWASNPGGGVRMINARSETVFEKPAFKIAVRERRCLVPARLFYEWRRSGRSRIPFGIRSSESSFFAFAGIWERREAEDELLETVAILTTSPNAIMASIHDRMPVILDLEARSRWLDHRNPADGGPSEIELRSYFTPVADDLVHVHRVSSRVNDANDAKHAKHEEHEEPGFMDPIEESPNDSVPPGLFWLNPGCLFGEVAGQ